MILFVLRLTLLVIFLPLASALEAADASDSPFAAATAAFAQGDYARALDLFEAARAAGAEGPAVPYNIAVCRYKLGQYASSEAEFRALRERFPSMRQVADYNRGLALLALGDEPEARDAFQVATTASDPKVAALAAEQLERLGAAVAPPTGVRWAGVFDAGLGHDDNVALVEELTLPAGRSADSGLLELLGYASRRIGARSSRLEVSGYVVEYADAGEFDQTSLRVAGIFVRTPGRWRFDVGPHYERSTLGSADFEREVGVTVRADRSIGDQLRFVTTLAYDDVSALDTTFEYLEGSKTRLGASIERRGRAATARVTYDVERNDRAAAAASSDRSRLAFGYRRALSASWLVDGTLSYRASSYDRVVGPDERLAEVGLGMDRTLRRGWRFRVEYRRSDNDADVPQFSYTSNRVVAGLGKVF